jgi:spore germination cell wall hydrolase CwlJ-like protein
MEHFMKSIAKFTAGIIVGAVGFWYIVPPVVEKIEIPVIETQTVVKEVKVPTVVVKEVVREIEVPKIIEKPVIQTVNHTRVIYKQLPNKDHVKPLVRPEEVNCMALNIYREANNQSVAGQIAVGRVVMNRVLDRRYPADTCSVIFEGPVRESWKTAKDPNLKPKDRIYYPKRDRCQFSWYCDGKKDEVINKENNSAWQTAEDIAYQILAFDRWRGILDGATHYHATYVSPKWMHELKRITKIDDHIFYKRG